MGTFQDVLRRRRMVRQFAQRPLERELVDRILESARHAPSAGFSQGFDFVVPAEPRAGSRFWKSEDPCAFPNPPDFLASAAPVIVLPLANKAAYRERYSQPDKEE